MWLKCFVVPHNDNLSVGSCSNSADDLGLCFAVVHVLYC